MIAPSIQTTATKVLSNHATSPSLLIRTHRADHKTVPRTRLPASGIPKHSRTRNSGNPVLILLGTQIPQRIARKTRQSHKSATKKTSASTLRIPLKHRQPKPATATSPPANGPSLFLRTQITTDNATSTADTFHSTITGQAGATSWSPSMEPPRTVNPDQAKTSNYAATDNYSRWTYSNNYKTIPKVASISVWTSKTSSWPATAVAADQACWLPKRAHEKSAQSSTSREST